MARVRIDSIIKAFFRQGIKIFYDTHETKTLKETFEQPVVLFFHQGWQLCIGALVPLLPPVEELPTLEQFRYWYLKECNLKCPMIVHEDKLIYQKGE